MPKYSFYWYDYETFGVDPRRDRPVQFAGIRTDPELNVVGDPLVLYCRPSDDYLPSPEACLVTGITPQKALGEGVPEAEFISLIHSELSRPQTCLVGYNNIRFDDEVTRFTLYRNFFDAYAHEWQNGNSRWDIIDVVRLTYALRPEGIEWPLNEDGRPSFRLDQLTVANNISHASAHDALSDVFATIELAKLIRDKQPRLFDYVFAHRSKQKIMELLHLDFASPVLHVSSMYSTEQGCIALVLPLAIHPENKNEVLVYDLRVDPESFFELGTDEILHRLFTRQVDLPADTPRLPIKSIHINKSPVVVPVNTLTADSAEKWGIDPQVADAHARRIAANPAFIQKLQVAYGERKYETLNDPDFMLYQGGFFSNADRERMELVRQSSPQELGNLGFSFDDQRLPEMLFRYRARNYPQTLTDEEKQDWQVFRRYRLLGENNGGLNWDAYRTTIRNLRQSGSITSAQSEILDALENYGMELIGDLVTEN